MKTFESEIKALSKMRVTNKIFIWAVAKKNFLTIFPEYFPNDFRISKQL